MGGTITAYSITELSGAVAVCAGALGGILVALFKSRCTEISCGWGMFRCLRDVPVTEGVEAAAVTAAVPPPPAAAEV